jgi:hypothetical protein
MSSTTNDPQGEYMSKAEANAMDRIRSVAKEAASKVEQMMVAKAMEQAKRKEFETIERNEYDEIMNAQEDADEAKYGKDFERRLEEATTTKAAKLIITEVPDTRAEQPKREPMLSNGEIQAMREVEYKMDGTDIAIIKRYAYLDGAMDARRWFRSKIDSGELIIVKTVKRSECVVTSSQMEQISLLCCGRVVRNDGDDIKNGEHCRCGAIFIDDAYPSQRSLSICKNCGLCETHIPPIGSHDCPRCGAKIIE